ncbi:MAG: hypothetical protein P4L79_10185 [Legionella sp.]|uniref:hypothetical protein n=1 Tax=Legionella sp. TaxID=459 RepID=UPI00284AFC00|nr:hypothetical protein [Legionella sp.]
MWLCTVYYDSWDDCVAEQLLFGNFEAAEEFAKKAKLFLNRGETYIMGGATYRIRFIRKG